MSAYIGPMNLQAAIIKAVEQEDRCVSIAQAIRRVREAISTDLPDVDLQTEIASAAAERGKGILFDLKR
ncbi:hypothetical protein P9279_22220 [Mesorhizobium sp. WSM4962]|uniref:hypothetical protein n=1 Tax=Mesorhizobium sp. WSM4962 TaxID=3038548 RepID=UPI002416A3CD|nr:hypothetical protein [Mesorhizobium sp. WSM4962]MDG4903230.1 hypothetical protein [Mesorhizobium sp. WSM4962]